MLKRIIVVLVFLALAVPALCQARNIKVKDFQDQTGIKVVHFEDMLLPGYANAGTIADVDKFKKQGFETGNKGDYVIFSVLDNGNIKVVLDSTGQSKIIEIVEAE